MGKKKGQETEESGRQTVLAKWNKELVLKFCDIGIEAIKLGLRPGTYFSPKGWEYVINSFARETGCSYTRKQFKNKWDNIKKDWKIWKQLKKETGVGWNSTLGTIQADNEWWEQKMKVLQGCEKFRYTGLDPELEERYDSLFLNSAATGKSAWTPASRVLLDSDEDKGGGGDGDGDGDGGGNGHGDGGGEDIEGGGDSEDEPNFVQSVNDMINGIDVGASSIQPGTQDSGKGKRRVDSLKEDANRNKKRMEVGAKLYFQMERLISRYESRSEVTFRRIDEVGCSIAEVMGELHSAPGMVIGSELHTFASIFFCQRTKRQMWNAMGSLEAKMIWLNKMFQLRNS